MHLFSLWNIYFEMIYAVLFTTDHWILMTGSCHSFTVYLYEQITSSKMLQWMGGSRRKVTASRKSMHNRQKQYFEQRKRQQQAPGLENHNDVRNKRAHYQEEPRSLDILSLTNLATIAHGDYSSHINDLGSLQVDCKPSELSPAMMLKKITCQYFNNLEETCSTAFLNKLSAAGSPQYAPAGHSLSSKLDDCKMPGSPCEFISNNTGSKSKEQQEEVQNEVSILDLLGDDGPKGKPEGRSVPEAHVAFSVEGLGKVGMETPVHSPQPHKRGFPSPPKASRCMHSSASLKSVSYDLGLELNAIMHDVSMSMDDSLPEILCNSRGLFNDMVFTNRTKFMDSYLCPDVFENRTNNFNDKEEIILAETRNKQWKSRSDVLDDDFLDGGKYDVLWKKTPFCSDGYPSICPNSKSSEIYDYGFGDNYFLKKRTAVEAHKRSDTSAPSSPYFSYSTSEKEYDFLAFDQDRYPVLKERSNLDSMFDPPAWSFLKTEDSKDSMSLLSEESCSSAAVREERSNGLRSDQMKLKDCKINHLDELHMSFDKKYNLEKVLEDEMICTSLGRASGERNLAGMENDKSISNQLSLKAGYCSEKASSHQGILEPNRISLFKNERRPANEASLAPSCPKSSTETNTASFDCNILHEDKLFDLFPVPKLNPTADLIQRRSESKVPSECEPSSNFNCENVEQLSAPGIQFQKSEAHPLGAAVADCKDSCSEHEESKYEELLDGPKTRNPFEEAGETALPTEELPLHLKRSCIDEKSDLSDGRCPVQYEVSNRDPMKEKLGPEKSFVKMGGNKTDTSYQVMHESYVLQLMCVQKVLMEASGKDDGKKVRELPFVHQFGEKTC
ncbi:uncharacterized protein LOC113460917 isoform X2 [Phoenix dactylifera]|uniref:Uncharacterized protein LOC113460917 isoform X2 n=1 Tax=Phoenix dactylifera TaxID=42345 RepID=A0A8B9AZM9_PHODC|nr:uncharacterized protein LOC113460917 isoform X2 [Phoenix dactylifera]